MELSTHKKRMSGQFNNFYQLFVGRKTGQQQPFFNQPATIIIVEFIAMAMTFADPFFAVGFKRL